MLFASNVGSLSVANAGALESLSTFDVGQPLSIQPRFTVLGTRCRMFEGPSQ